MSYKFMFALKIIFGKISVVVGANVSGKRINIFQYFVVAYLPCLLKHFFLQYRKLLRQFKNS